jgi:NAD(P)-dependent dehydrogenase (short-subunit alcohol dehydrogenase family)
MTSSDKPQKTWFITGSSRGFGREWALAALERGDQVVATARSAADLRDMVDRFQGTVLALEVDVTDRPTVVGAVARAKEHFGRIDVVVNNAGYGMFGMIEETSESQARHQFETNFFGSLWVTQAVLPLLREQGAGHIIQISSVAGLTSFPGLGMYAASKWALEGMSQALAGEVRPFGIKVTLVEPTGYLTDRGGGSHIAAPLPPYESMRAAVLEGSKSSTWGDPRATCQAMLDLADAPEPPLRLFLGDGPLSLISQEYTERLATWREWESTSIEASGT